MRHICHKCCWYNWCLPISIVIEQSPYASFCLVFYGCGLHMLLKKYQVCVIFHFDSEWKKCLNHRTPYGLQILLATHQHWVETLVLVISSEFWNLLSDYVSTVGDFSSSALFKASLRTPQSWVQEQNFAISLTFTIKSNGCLE